MHSKNIIFTLFYVITLTSFIRCSQDSLSSSQRRVKFQLPTITAQDLLARGLLTHDFPMVKSALAQQADPNKILGHTPFGERTYFNTYLAGQELNYDIVAFMLQNGATPTVDTDRILDHKPRDFFKVYLRSLVAKQRHASNRAEFHARIGISDQAFTAQAPTTKPTSQHHVDPTAL